MLETSLAAIEIPDELTEPISAQGKRHLLAPTPDNLRVYIDSYIDFCRLLEEIRFEVGLAVLLLADSALKRQHGEAPDRPTRRDYPMPVEVDALLRRYFRELPWPAMLFQNPYAELAGDRVLGRWFAAQLLDSAMYRTLAACDRLAILLWANAELPFEEDPSGNRIHPAFRRRYLRRLDDCYGKHAAWPELTAVVDDELFQVVKSLRDGFTHSRRLRSQLHGDFVSEYIGDQERGIAPVAAIDARDHVALALAFYDGILRRLVGLTAQVLPEASASRPSP